MKKSSNKAQVTFKAMSETETKAIVIRDEKTYTARVLHASPDDIAEFKIWKEKYLSENRVFV